MLSAAGWVASSSELRSLNLASGKTDSVLPGVSVEAYDLSRDETEVVYTTKQRDGTSQMWLASLDSTERTSLGPVNSQAQYASGYLLFNRGATLVAQPFDTSQGRASGDALTVASGTTPGGGVQALTWMYSKLVPTARHWRRWTHGLEPPCW